MEYLAVLAPEPLPVAMLRDIIPGGDVLAVVVEAGEHIIAETPPELIGGHPDGSCGGHGVQDFPVFELTEKLINKHIVFYHDGYQ